MKKPDAITEITKENFNTERGKCQKIGEICEDYWKLFFDKRKKEVNELILSIYAGGKTYALDIDIRQLFDDINDDNK